MSQANEAGNDVTQSRSQSLTKISSAALDAISAKVNFSDINHMDETLR